MPRLSPGILTGSKPWGVPASHQTGRDHPCGNIYNPFILWRFFPQSGKIPPPLKNLRKTLPAPRNQVRRMGLQKVWVP